MVVKSAINKGLFLRRQLLGRYITIPIGFPDSKTYISTYLHEQ